MSEPETPCLPECGCVCGHDNDWHALAAGACRSREICACLKFVSRACAPTCPNAPKAETPPCACLSRVLDDGLPATSHRVSCSKHPFQAEALPTPKEQPRDEACMVCGLIGKNAHTEAYHKVLKAHYAETPVPPAPTCPRCSGEGCSPQSVQANGPCGLDKPEIAKRHCRAAEITLNAVADSIRAAREAGKPA